MNSEIQAIGRFLPQDASGYLLNDCSAAYIVPPWSDALNDTIQAYLQHSAGQIHSLYVRGSLPRGLALPESDLDTLAVLVPGSAGLSPAWVEPFTKAAKKKYPFVSKFEFHPFHHESALNAPEHFNTRFVIKTLSLCVWGEDLGPKIAPFKPDLKLAISFHGNIANEIQQALRRLKTKPDVEACRWIMKRVIRAGFCLGLGRERRFTRDLYLCWEVFSKYYPERSQVMYRAMEAAVMPERNIDQATLLLEELGPWLVAEAHRLFFLKPKEF